ncbi:MAG: hypothetical protein ABI064_07795 [Acidobacteriaceae bacterium]
MAKKIYKPEGIVNLLRQVEVAVANGRVTPQACKPGSWSRHTIAGAGNIAADLLAVVRSRPAIANG